MEKLLPSAIFVAGLGQFGVLVAAALVPFRLNWKSAFVPLTRLHRQMYWVYGGYIVLSIVAFAWISVRNADELAAGSGLARAFCFFVAVFWGIRLGLQNFLDVREHLTRWWLYWGYHLLTVLFASFTVIYGWAALRSAP